MSERITGMDMEIVRYTKEWEDRWDRFVMNRSVNGTFLQTRNFLNYHPVGRFEDASILCVQGSNIVAVIPACATREDGKKCFFSHKGSTFGGIILDREKYNISTLDTVFSLLEKHYIQCGYKLAYIKDTSNVFSSIDLALSDYFFYKYGYSSINELSFYIDCAELSEDIVSTWTSGRRRDYRYSLQNGLVFKQLKSEKEIKDFYEILVENLALHNTGPVHTFDELIDLWKNRLSEIIDFYGVCHDEKLIAGTMLFYFNSDVLHTQYLAQRGEYANLFTMNFLDYNLIKLAKEKGYKKFSFGISTENRGKDLNMGLALFKEGFGTKFCNNRSYKKEL